MQMMGSLKNSDLCYDKNHNLMNMFLKPLWLHSMKRTKKQKVYLKNLRMDLSQIVDWIRDQNRRRAVLKLKEAV